MFTRPSPRKLSTNAPSTTRAWLNCGKSLMNSICCARQRWRRQKSIIILYDRDRKDCQSLSLKIESECPSWANPSRIMKQQKHVPPHLQVPCHGMRGRPPFPGSPAGHARLEWWIRQIQCPTLLMTRVWSNFNRNYFRYECHLSRP